MVRQITPREVALHVANGRSVHLLDVRQPWEEKLASLPGSQLIPLNELPRRASEIKPAEDDLLIVFCHHGIRSLTAADYLERLGYRDVLSLAGGIDRWSCEVDPAIPRY